MSGSFRFDPVELPPECEALSAEVRTFIAAELAAGLWVPNSDFGSHRSAAFSRRLTRAGGGLKLDDLKTAHLVWHVASRWL
jgi:hypothetical protein